MVKGVFSAVRRRKRLSSSRHDVEEQSAQQLFDKLNVQGLSKVRGLSLHGDVCALQLYSHRATTARAALADASGHLYTCCIDHETSRPSAAIMAKIKAHAGAINFLLPSHRHHPDHYITIESDGGARAWQLCHHGWQGGDVVPTCGPGLLAADSSDGMLITGGSGGCMTLSHEASPQPVAVIPTVDCMKACTFVRHHPFAVAASSYTELKLYDLRMHRCYRTVRMDTSARDDGDNEQALESCVTHKFAGAHRTPVYDLCTSDRHDVLYSASVDAIVAWDLTIGVKIAVHPHPGICPFTPCRLSLASLRHREIVAYGCKYGNIQLLNLSMANRSFDHLAELEAGPSELIACHMSSAPGLMASDTSGSLFLGVHKSDLTDS